uniref:DNA-directed RNA polymerase n=1 Tax=Anotrichium furcellatum TaxID=41999 RepID=A0A4D6WRH0_9FLOR|nr:RNA polymerase b'-subunit [Anotrichium furcellatum]
MKSTKIDIPYFNKVIDKSQLKHLITWAFRNYGIARASNMVDELKNLGFYYATKAGISLSLEDLRIPPGKQSLLDITLESIANTDIRYKRGEITAIERFQKVIDTWNEASENLKEQIISYFKDTDPLNSIYMMAFSGARANISQVRQLVGMRGLMADPQGQIIDLPIANNFREGLNVTDYFISSYGARKGLVDTALRTADSGYLTRRLVDVAQDVIIREHDCKTFRGVLISEMSENQTTLITLKQALLGRVLAEDLYHPLSKVLISKANQSIDMSLASEIVNAGIVNILVRSPLTCSSIRSVCQLCYGWNLAHGQMVDLGEAVGIIAAQSIGEPGTQLTMRTFHTGGVFTGQLEKTLKSEVDGKIEYSSNIILTKTRTKYGDYASLLSNDAELLITSIANTQHVLSLPKGSLILVSNHSFIQKNQPIAQYPSNNRLPKERAQKTIITDFSGSIYFNEFNDKSSTNNNRIKLGHSLNFNTIIWVLFGQVYDIPTEAELIVQNNEIIQSGSLIARNKLISTHRGLIQLIQNTDNKASAKVLLVTSSKSFKNCQVWIDRSSDSVNYILDIASKDKFILKNNFSKRIVNNQVIADLMSNAYKTKTGGIIKYLDMSVLKSKIKHNEKDVYDITGEGYILWIAEETHIINKDISLLLVSHGQFVEAGTEIIQNVFVNNSGVLEVIQKDGVVREVVVKPGNLYKVNDSNLLQVDNNGSKYRGFLRPGEHILGDIYIDKLAYWEYIQIQEEDYVLVRPVIVYSVPKKSLNLEVTKESFATDIVNLKLLRRTNFRDGERIKSVLGVNLITTHLAVELSSKVSNLQCSMQLDSPQEDVKYFYLKFITADLLFVKDNYIPESNDLYSETSILVKNNQFIEQGSIIAHTDIFASIQGRVSYIQSDKLVNRRILVVGDADIITFNVDHNQSILVKVGDWVYAGDNITTKIIVSESGKVISINNKAIIIRIGQPYLISSGSFLHVEDNSLVKRGENIATLIYNRSKTGDIVQGLPRIEEILEARKKIDASFNPHFILESKFRYYLNQGLNLYDATRYSFLEIQLFLLKEIQLVYQSQGVEIADKHIEVIVRQMTSKVKIQNGGDTHYLPGEIVDLRKVESINKSLSVISQSQASYTPILLGITKASLTTDSFISAASFQETTKVLTDAAISGKLDWLRGLKENVIIGRLIPAGTGFNAYHTQLHADESIISNNLIKHEGNFNVEEVDKFNDIIIDDRNINSYPFLNE